MGNIRKVNPNPFHPLFAALRDRAMRIEKDALTSDANRCVAIVSYADGLLGETSEKTEKLKADYKRSEEYLKKSYNSVKWLSLNCLGKLYVGLELRGLRSTPQRDRIIYLNELSNEVKQNLMFQDALELLRDAGLIELENKNSKVRITPEGTKYLQIVFEN